MRTRSIWLGVCSAVLLIAATAPAASIQGNGTLSDWFDIAPSSSDTYQGYDLADGIYQYLDEEGPTPGGGGQDYDSEAFLYTYDSGSGNTYIGLVTGFDPGGEPPLEAGDLFIDLGGVNGYDLAIGLSTDNSRSGNVYVADFGISSNYDSVIVPGFVGVSDPYRAKDATIDSDGPIYANVEYIDLAGDRWLYEICIEGLGYNPLEGAGIGLHWTMECGNDFINAQAVVPVPAAAPVALIGMVMIGVARRVRRRKS